MTATAEKRRCPVCREDVDRVHCSVKECGWWICDACGVQFNRKGRTVGARSKE